MGELRVLCRLLVLNSDWPGTTLLGQPAGSGGLFCGVDMAAVKISGVLKDGAGKPIQNCTIQLK
ncbi:prophage tail fiber N-terminal domain-containing protein, partial [Escherichia coli]|uniref:prophage tail fiber N-terminal domain-containing protein n=1 Tax=Escherichia coli TaxID=562 RepID=UPI00207B6340